MKDMCQPITANLCPPPPPPNATISSTASCAGRSKWPLSGISDRHAQLPLGLGTLEPDSVQVPVFTV